MSAEILTQRNCEVACTKVPTQLACAGAKMAMPSEVIAGALKNLCFVCKVAFVCKAPSVARSTVAKL